MLASCVENSHGRRAPPAPPLRADLPYRPPELEAAALKPARRPPTPGPRKMDKELRDQLATLHAELARARSVDPQSRELLITLLNDITRLLGGGAAEQTQGDRSPRERLGEFAVQFEAEHPALGTALRQVVDTLAKAGI
ncbi:MAG TPA: DUF4404 family protein [Steroidobacter sp.]|nr:DUF4404 family protein [Steroidobacter sp.]